MLSPHVAFRDCDFCHKFLHDPDSGAVEKSPDGKPLIRQPNNPPPCREMKGRVLVGCPKGTPEKSKALNARNRKALWHFYKCSAVGDFPADPIVRRNAAIIAQTRESCEALLKWQTLQALRTLQALPPILP